MKEIISLLHKPGILVFTGISWIATLLLFNGCTTCAEPEIMDCNSNNLVFTLVEDMPEFPGGNDSLNSYIKTNLVYPSSAVVSEINGKVFAKFTIDTVGNVICPEILTSLTPDCDNEVLRLIKAMPKWIPGKQSQKKVFVSLSMNFEFLYDSSKYDLVYKFVEQMPQFPGGDSAMLAFINSNLIYPDSAKINKIEGTVVVACIVDKYGNVISPALIRGIYPPCDQEALRILTVMPAWIPGRHNGKNVKVSFTLPIRFKL